MRTIAASARQAEMMNNCGTIKLLMLEQLHNLLQCISIALVVLCLQKHVQLPCVVVSAACIRVTLGLNHVFGFIIAQCLGEDSKQLCDGCNIVILIHQIKHLHTLKVL